MHVGEIKAWCEAAKNDAKRMSLSATFKPDDYNEIKPYMGEYAQKNGIEYYLEKRLIQTDLFGDMDLSGIWVFIIYKYPKILEEYLALKKEKAELCKKGKYIGEKRREIAIKFGRLLGYSEECIVERWN
jgi:hypothetical protein